MSLPKETYYSRISSKEKVIATEGKKLLSVFVLTLMLWQNGLVHLIDFFFN